MRSSYFGYIEKTVLKLLKSKVPIKEMLIIKRSKMIITPTTQGILYFLFSLLRTGSKTKETRIAIVNGIKTEDVSFNMVAITIVHKNKSRINIALAKFVYFFIVLIYHKKLKKALATFVTRAFFLFKLIYFFLITSKPQKGTRTSGTVIEPSAF